MPLKSAALFEKMDPFIKSQGTDLVKKINAVYFFEVSKAKRETKYVKLILKMEMDQLLKEQLELLMLHSQ